jgi:hypothetical protein
VGAAQVLPGEVVAGAPRAPVRRPDQRARLPQQGGDGRALGVEVHRPHPGRVAGGQPRHPPGGPVRGVVQGGGRGTRPHVRQVPEQLVQPAHHREHGEHRRGALATAEDDLNDVLARAEAVVGHAAGEAARAQLRVDRAAVVGTEVDAGLPGWLVVGEVR